MIKRIIFLLLLAIATVARAQTYTVVAPESQFLTLSFPAGTVWDMGNTADNKWSPDQTTTEWTAFTPYYPELAGQLREASVFPDPDANQPKVFRVLQTTVVQQVYVTDRNNNNAQTTITVPALPVTPPITFAPGSVATVAVSNIPPTTPNAPLAGVVTLRMSGISVKLVCLYNSTVTNTDTPPSLAALFSCVVQ